MAKKGYIYKYTYPNGKVFIGSTTVSVKESHYQHMCASRNPHRWTLCDWAIYVYGEPTVETIETIEVADNEGKKHFHDGLKELNENNVELYINNIKYKFSKYFRFTKGLFDIKLKFNGLSTMILPLKAERALMCVVEEE